MHLSHQKILPLHLSAFISKTCRKNTRKYQDVRLVLLGSSRNEGDEAIIRELEKMTKSLGIDANVDFVVNAPFDQ